MEKPAGGMIPGHELVVEEDMTMSGGGLFADNERFRKQGLQRRAYRPLGGLVRVCDDIEGRRLFANLFVGKRSEPRHDLRTSGLGEDIANPERIVVGEPHENLSPQIKAR